MQTSKNGKLFSTPTTSTVKGRWAASTNCKKSIIWGEFEEGCTKHTPSIHRDIQKGGCNLSQQGRIKWAQGAAQLVPIVNPKTCRNSHSVGVWKASWFPTKLKRTGPMLSLPNRGMGK